MKTKTLGILIAALLAVPATAFFTPQKSMNPLARKCVFVIAWERGRTAEVDTAWLANGAMAAGDIPQCEGERKAAMVTTYYGMP